MLPVTFRANGLDWKNQNDVFEHMAAINYGGSVTLTGSGRPEELQGVRVSASYFDIFGVQAVLGRTFAPDEDQLGKSQVVVLSHRLWENRFGADPSIVGRTLRLSGKPCTVIGVMPANTPFDRSYAQLWMPLAFEPGDMTRDYHWILSFARLKPGVTLEKTQAAMNAIGARIAEAYPESNKGWGVTVERFEDQVVGQELRRSLFVLLAAVGAILLIGCANLANLTLARGAAREREIAVRASLGAGSWRLIRQLLTENLLVAGAGGALGLALGYGMIRGLIRLAPPFSFPSEADVSIDVDILLFTLGVSLLTALLFGLAPAIHATRVDPASAMKEGGRSATSGAGRARLRNALIVAEVALAFVLLAGAGLQLLPHAAGRYRIYQHQRHDRLVAHRPRPFCAPRATRAIRASPGRAPAGSAGRARCRLQQRPAHAGLGRRYAVPDRRTPICRPCQPPRLLLQTRHQFLLPHARHPPDSGPDFHR